MKSRFAFAAVASAALAFSLAAGAAELPAPQTMNGITYLSGGIGHKEAVALKAEAKSYPLALVFSAGPRHAFVSEVKVTIKDKAGNVVFDSTSDGPLMLIKLPAGHYSIEAVQGGATLHRTLQVAVHEHKQLAFYWQKA